MFFRKVAYHYLLFWPMVAVVFIVAVDNASNTFRQEAAFQLASDHMAEQLEDAKHIVLHEGTGYLAPNEAKRFETLDIYIADADQEAVTKPRWAEVGNTITNKAIVRCLNLKDDEIEQWVSPADYRGVPVLSVYTPITLDGQRMALIAEMDQEEIMGRLFRWWFYADAAWVAMFAGVAGLCLIVLRKDIVRFVRTEQDAIKVDPYAILIKLVRQFPLIGSGIALVDKQGVITDCSPSFAKILGAFGTRDVLGKSVHSFHPDPERHKQMFESFNADLVERPVTFLSVDKAEVKAILSVTLLNGCYLVLLRKAD